MAALATHQLSVTRKNAVLGAIQAAGLDPADFIWRDTLSSQTLVGAGGPAYTVEQLTHKPTGYWFRFDDANRGSLWAVYQPGPEGALKQDHAGTWEHVFSYVQRWLGWVRDEYDAPNLWAELQQGRDRLGSAPQELENTPFTPPEQAEIARQLREIGEYVRQTYQLSAEQSQAIETRLDYFAQASARLSRVDWRNAFVGAFVGLALQAMLPTQPVQELLYMVLRGLAGLFGGDLPEVPGLPLPGA